MLNVENLIFLFILENGDRLSGTNCVSWKDAKKEEIQSFSAHFENQSTTSLLANFEPLNFG